MKLKRFVGDEVRELRRKCGMNQAEFWTRFMTTQSGGSRYESGRDIPEPVQVLLNIAFGSEGKVAGIVEHLRELGARKKGQTRRSEPKRVVEH
ncbi:helix-turn-helix domain-containing protein [Thauera mechernichensis]|uniref:Helix-turn-helix domain-containing protein n=1 Tax=Thauera mechernichensis TaxID=82788 RepID=A0ABW3WF45_9RHOO|nr:XRE family transcriptional regulator [Thauera mechernichensis]MDG3065135.1 XRE family transcriptional regulator [Thauera mechernichensis]